MVRNPERQNRLHMRFGSEGARRTNRKLYREIAELVHACGLAGIDVSVTDRCVREKGGR